MLVQVARQEAAANPPRAGTQRTGVAPGGLRRTGSAGDLRRNPLRRSASLDGSDFGGRANGGAQGMLGGIQVVSSGGAGCSSDAHSMAGLDGRPRSAGDAMGNNGELLNGAVAWGAMGGMSMGGARNGVGNHPLRQRQAQARAAAQAAQLQQQFVRRAAASTLQAHWRGWQHRRLARYLRARRKRAMRLDWLWHLEYVTNLMQWHEAAHTVQAVWRGRRDPALLKQQKQQQQVGGGASGKTVAPKDAAGLSGSNNTNTTASSLPSPPPANTDGDDATAPADAAPARVGKEGAKPAPAESDAGAQDDAASPAAQKPRSQGYTGGSPSKAGRRLTVHWPDVEPDRPLAEVRHYAVVAPAPPRW